MDPTSLTSAEVPWRCPNCRGRLARRDDPPRWCCAEGHSFDVAREGYVNLLVAGQRRSRQPGDNAEMVRARRRFLGTGAYDPLTSAVAGAATCDGLLVDVGCGEGRHTRGTNGAAVAGIDVSKLAVAYAARAHHGGSYAVASTADIPLETSSVDTALVVFGPVLAGELARVVRAGGRVVAAHPGPEHLPHLREMVYGQARPHEVKEPLRDGRFAFELVEVRCVRFPVRVEEPGVLADLFAMTPYRWHAPADIGARIQAARYPLETVADVRISVYRRSSES